MPFVRGTSTTGTSTISTTLEITGTDRLLVVQGMSPNGTLTLTVDSVSQPTTAWDGTEGIVANNGTQRRVWALVAPPTGAAVEIALSNSAGDTASLHIALFDDVDQSSPLGTAANELRTGETTVTVTVTSATGDNVVGGVFGSAFATNGLSSYGAGQSAVGTAALMDSGAVVTAMSHESGESSTTHDYVMTGAQNFYAWIWGVGVVSAAPSATPYITLQFNPLP